jgi:putative peptide zinc metalloprotease protein
VLAGAHWSELTNNLADRVLATESLLLLLLTYPFVKALHELGHGYAVKKWGGEVHEIGVMFLVFMPVPYVDASAASVFHEKWRRALVGAAGILVEMFLAALALFVWLNAEEGVSTLLFNGNPLLRFDGYYVLADLIEVPNLGMRSNRYLGYLIQRHLFGVASAESPVTARGEAPWLFCYAIASFCYRIFIMTAIVSFVASKFFVIGVLIAIWAMVLMLGVPLVKQLRFLLTSPVLRRRRGRALSVTAAVMAAVATVLLVIPLPYATVTEGVVWASSEAAVHAGAEGTVAEVLARPNTLVAEGDPLIRMEDPFLDARVKVLEARVRELQLRYADRDVTNLVEAKIVAEQLRHAEADLKLARKHQRDLLVRSRTGGQFMLPDAADLPGRFVHKGEVLGFTTRLDDTVVRVIVAEAEAELVQQRTSDIEVRFVERMAETIPATIERKVPLFSGDLPSMALSTLGGGEIAIDPTSPERMQAFAKLLHLELKPASMKAVSALGGRVYVRFSHGAEPLAFRIYRKVRQVFLKQFNV